MYTIINLNKELCGRLVSSLFLKLILTTIIYMYIFI